MPDLSSTNSAAYSPEEIQQAWVDRRQFVKALYGKGGPSSQSAEVEKAGPEDARGNSSLAPLTLPSDPPRSAYREGGGERGEAEAAGAEAPTRSESSFSTPQREWWHTPVNDADMDLPDMTLENLQAKEVEDLVMERSATLATEQGKGQDPEEKAPSRVYECYEGA